MRNSSMCTCIAVLLSGVLLSTATLAVAQESSVKKTPIQQTSATSGAEMFKTYCAVCHGADAKGNGPAASALKVAPPNLTTLAKRYNGKFPDSYVVTVLQEGPAMASHGSKDMPIWGNLFGAIGGAMNTVDSPQVKLRISNLTHYLESLQEK